MGSIVTSTLSRICSNYTLKGQCVFCQIAYNVPTPFLVTPYFTFLQISEKFMPFCHNFPVETMKSFTFGSDKITYDIYAKNKQWQKMRYCVKIFQMILTNSSSFFVSSTTDNFLFFKFFVTLFCKKTLFVLCPFLQLPTNHFNPKHIHPISTIFFI